MQYPNIFIETKTAREHPVRTRMYQTGSALSMDKKSSAVRSSVYNIIAAYSYEKQSFSWLILYPWINPVRFFGWLILDPLITLIRLIKAFPALTVAYPQP